LIANKGLHLTWSNYQNSTVVLLLEKLKRLPLILF